MKIVKSVAEMLAYAYQTRQGGKAIGFVPTMGALHEGHISLVRRARRENDRLVVSIFVNPLQFGPKEDFKKYPRTATKDLALLETEKTDIVFMPSPQAMYPEGYSTRIRVASLDAVLEGVVRPDHFQGVATVVCKLFNMVQPTRAYFGQKDFQQVRIIRQMIEDLNIPVRLVACPTVRESDGLAMSSRNRYLSMKERAEAVKIYQALYLGRELVSERIMLDSHRLNQRLLQVLKTIPHVKIDYIAIVDPMTLVPMARIRRPAILAIAVRIGKTRLIDNVVIS
jgi:pantoate--beta-alanine ligase